VQDQTSFFLDLSPAYSGYVTALKSVQKSTSQKDQKSRHCFSIASSPAVLFAQDNPHHQAIAKNDWLSHPFIPVNETSTSPMFQFSANQQDTYMKWSHKN